MTVDSSDASDSGTDGGRRHTSMQTGISVPEGYGIGYADAVELALDRDCDFVEVLLDGRGRPEVVGETLGPALHDDLDLVVHLPFTVPLWSPIESYQRGLEDVHEACLDAAAELGATAAVVHPSDAAMGDAFDDDAVVDGVLDSIRDVHAYGQRRDVEVCIENVQSGPFTLGGLSRVATETDASLVLDTGHARVAGHDLDDLLAFVDAHGDDVAHLHLNDTRGASDDHLTLGAGTVDFEAFLGAFDADWSGRAAVEAIVADVDSLATSVDRLHAILEGLDRR